MNSAESIHSAWVVLGVGAVLSAVVAVQLALLAVATPRDAAQRFDVSLNTIRSQMAAIFGKTGISGQADLSRLMVRLAGQP